MANTQTATNNQAIQFGRDFFMEYVRKNRLSSFSGTGDDNPIVVVETPKQGGTVYRHPLITRLSGSGVTGSSTLRGNGENMGNYSAQLNLTYYRNAVEFDKEEMEKPNFNIFNAARPSLMAWAKSGCRDRQIQAFGSIKVTSGDPQNLADADNTARDAWLAANSDRVIFGDSIAAGGDFSAGLDGVDASNDTLTAARVDDMRKLAELADPHIMPIETDEEGEVYVLLVGSNSYYNLSQNLQTLYSNADVRGMRITKGGNALARQGDLYWRGVIVRHVPEITQIFTATGKTLATEGAASQGVEPAFLTGAQGLIWAMSQRPRIITDMDYDFQFQPGVAVELREDVVKSCYQTGAAGAAIDHGVVTGYFSA